MNKQSTDNRSGEWLVAKYGWHFSLNGDSITAFQRTATTCTPLHILTGKLQKGALATELGTFQFSAENNRLRITAPVLFGSVYADPTTLPHTCHSTQADDPIHNFELFWHTFADFYPFFDLYGVDWQARYAEFRPKVTLQTTSEQLAVLLTELVAPLKDSHITIETEAGEFTPDIPHPNWVADIKSVAGLIGERYVSDLQTIGEGRIRFGRLAPDVGYVLIAGFGVTESAESDQAILVTALDEAMDALQNCTHLVIDVRFNQGGYDAIALEMAGRFTDDARVVLSRRDRTPFGTSQPTVISIKPTGSAQYTHPITLLTSGLTVSAAEIFAQAMRQLPHVLHVGEATAGFLSDAMPRFLPNGTYFTLSHEQIVDPDGKLLEGRGCVPTVTIPVQAAQENDAALDWVLANYSATPPFTNR